MEEGFNVMVFDYDDLQGLASSRWGWSEEIIRLPSDHLDMESLHGPCRTYHLGKPLTLAQLEAMPEDLQLRYLRQLRRRGGSCDSVGKMLGLAPGQLSARWQVRFDKPNPTAWANFLGQC